MMIEANTEDFPTIVNRLLTLALTQHCYTDFLREAMDECLRAVDGKRAFLARIEQESGELVIAETAGTDWTDETRRLRLVPHNETQRGITGYVAITGEPYITDDVSKDPHYIRHFDDVRSEVAVPFFDAEGRVRGVLNVDSDQLAAFTPLHVARLTTLANSIAIALASDEYRTREQMLVQIGLDLASTSEIETLMHRVTDVVARVLRCEACSIFLFDEAGEILTLRAARGVLKNQVGMATYRPGEGLTGTIALTGESIRLDDPREDPRWAGRYPEFSPSENSAFLATPIVGRDHILGVVRVSRPRVPAAWFRARFTESDERVLRTIAGQFGIAIENIWSFNRLVRTERMAAWGELSAKSAHMIGNRTFAIKGDLNELKYLLSRCTDVKALTQKDMCAEITALVESVERGVYRLEDILREFRDFVMATQLNLKPVDLNQVVRETVAEIFPKRGPVRLEEDYALDLPNVRADVEKLRRAFSELVENSVSFMPEGGTLHVSTFVIESGQIPPYARLSPARRYAQVEFADTGPGVPEDRKETIFKPFFSSRVKGMGLGLSIVKGVIDAHQGKIREIGEPGKGARFVIFIPLGETQ